jgi:hypothetical protein
MGLTGKVVIKGIAELEQQPRSTEIQRLTREKGYTPKAY